MKCMGMTMLMMSYVCKDHAWTIARPSDRVREKN